MSKTLASRKVLNVEPLSRVPPLPNNRFAISSERIKVVVTSLSARYVRNVEEEAPDLMISRVPKRKRSKSNDKNLLLLASCSELSRATKRTNISEINRHEAPEIGVIDLSDKGVDPTEPTIQVEDTEATGEGLIPPEEEEVVEIEEPLAETREVLGLIGSKDTSGGVVETETTQGRELMLIEEVERGNGFDAFLDLSDLPTSNQVNFLQELLVQECISGPSTVGDTPGSEGLSGPSEGPSGPSESVPTGIVDEQESLRAIEDFAASPHFREDVNHIHTRSIEFSSGIGKLKEHVNLLCEGLAMGERVRDSLSGSFIQHLKASQELHEEEKDVLEKQLETAREAHAEEKASLERRCAALEVELAESKEAEARAIACFEDLHSQLQPEPVVSGPDLIAHAAELADMEQRLSEKDSLLAAKDREMEALRVALGEARLDSMLLRQSSAAGVMPLSEVQGLLVVERGHGQAEGQSSFARVVAGDGVSTEKLHEWHSACPSHPRLRKFHPWFPFSQEEILLSREFDWRRTEGIPWVPPSIDSSLSFGSLFGNIERIYVDIDMRDIERIEGNRSSDPSWIRIGDRFVGLPEVGSSRFVRSGRRRVVELTRPPLSFLPFIEDPPPPPADS